MAVIFWMVKMLEKMAYRINTELLFVWKHNIFQTVQIKRISPQLF